MKTYSVDILVHLDAIYLDNHKSKARLKFTKSLVI